MIKLEKEWKVETDCRTVGEFMTEAAALGLSVKVSINDCDNYFFEGGQKVKVVDDTPIDKVMFDRTDYTLHARASFRVFTKPKPKTVMKSGWVNIWRSETDGLTYCGENIYEDKSFAERVGEDCGNNIATAKIEWEEVEK